MGSSPAIVKLYKGSLTALATSPSRVLFTVTWLVSGNLCLHQPGHHQKSMCPSKAATCSKCGAAKNRHNLAAGKKQIGTRNAVVCDEDETGEVSLSLIRYIGISPYTGKSPGGVDIPNVSGSAHTSHARHGRGENWNVTMRKYKPL